MSAPARSAKVCDVLVAGSGAAGLATAVAARAMGLDVVVAESAEFIGGTTAWSGGELWVPANRWQRDLGREDSPNEAFRYLQAAAEGRVPADVLRTYVEEAAGAVDFLVGLGAMEVEPMLDAPDYEMHLPGACSGGRTLRTVPFDGRRLGPDFQRLRTPLAAGVMLGGLSIAREDLVHIRSMTRSLRSAFHVGRLVSAHALHRAGGLHRGARTTMGNAMIARFLAWLQANSVPILTGTRLVRLQKEGGRVTGAVLEQGAQPVPIRARRAVVLATGGFSHDSEQQRARYGHVARGHRQLPLPPPEVRGDGLRLALEVGGILRNRVAEPAAWTAVSVVPGRPEPMLVPHFGDRAKPGIIAVLIDGRRFANEASDYHVFCKALIGACATRAETEAWLVTDHAALRRYGLGRVGPAPSRLGPALRSGYLMRGRDAAELARMAGIDPEGLARTLEAWNRTATTGRDTEFGKGESAFDRSSGDPDHAPNPCVATIGRGPLYAIRIQPGNLSTFVGLDTDPAARVRDRFGHPIAGLYAIGADAESLAGGSYPAAGITLGPAITFGVLAARDIAASQAGTGSQEEKRNSA